MNRPWWTAAGFLARAFVAGELIFGYPRWAASADGAKSRNALWILAAGPLLGGAMALALVLALATWTSPGAELVPGHKSQALTNDQLQEMEKTVQRQFQVYRKTFDLLEKSSDEAEVHRLADPLVREWQRENPERYGENICDLCSAIQGAPLGDNGTRLSVQYAALGLKRAESTPLDTVEHLLRIASQYAALVRLKLPDDELAARRAENARLWLRTWERIERQIDPTWVNEETWLNLVPPDETGLPSGIAPEAIADPILRARYEADIAENGRKVRRNNQQRMLRKLAALVPARAEPYLIAAYSRPPARPGELEKLLREFPPKDPKFAARVLEAVERESRFELLEKATDAAEVHRMADSLVRQWRSENPEQFGRYMSQLCSAIQSGRLGDEGVRLSAQYAALALRRAESLPLDTVEHLLRIASLYAARVRLKLPDDELAARRAENARLWLRTWQRIEESQIDPTWVEEEIFSVGPPDETGLPVGVAPEAIADPILRARYEADIAENNRKIERNNQQSMVRILASAVPARAEEYLIAAYGRPPARPGELEKLLREFPPKDPKFAARVLEAVEREAGVPSR
jgi:hypothetical protein